MILNIGKYCVFFDANQYVVFLQMITIKLTKIYRGTKLLAKVLSIDTRVKGGQKMLLSQKIVCINVAVFYEYIILVNLVGF